MPRSRVLAAHYISSCAATVARSIPNRGWQSATRLLSAAAAATLIVFGLHQDVDAASQSANTGETYKQLNLFGDVFELVRNDYVDEVKDDTLVEGAINGMLTALDPHSNYLNSKNFNDMKVQTREIG